MKAFFEMMGQRIQALVAKCISVKALVFAMACALVWFEKVPWYAWLLAGFAWIGLRYLEKVKGVFGK